MKRIWTELTIDMSTGEVDMSESSYEMVPDDYEFPVQAKAINNAQKSITKAVGLGGVSQATGIESLSNNLFPDVPKAPTAEELAKGYIDVTDSISGVQQKIVRDAQGNPVRIEISELPRSAEDQAIYDKYQSLLADQLGVLQNLSSPELASQIPEFQPILNDIRERNDILLDRSQGKITRQQETQLAKFGQADSTAAVEQRVAREAQFAEQRQLADLTVEQEAENLRNQQFNRSLQAINTAQALKGQSQNITANAIGNVGAQQQTFGSTIAGLQQQSFANQLQTQALQQQQTNQMLQLGATAAGFALSDRRAKENLTVIGEKAGLPWYSFNYQGESESQEGFVAQEVMTKYPEAVKLINGLLHVNYDTVFSKAGV